MMADHIGFRVMTQADIPLGMSLKRQAGWNQTRQDWQRFMAMSPQGCFVATAHGSDVGTAATFVMGDIGWIAMMLVAPAAQGQGVGTAIMNHCISHLRQQGVRSIRLDATPQGKPVYLKLGFQPQFELQRWEGTLPTNEPEAVDGTLRVRAATTADLPAITAMDRQSMATDRKTLLEHLLQEDDAQAIVVHRSEALAAYGLSRRGANATFIGPCVATDQQAGLALLETLGQLHAGQRVLVDVPVQNEASEQWFKRYLKIQRPLTRMSLGDQPLETLDHLWASSGPEKG